MPESYSPLLSLILPCFLRWNISLRTRLKTIGAKVRFCACWGISGKMKPKNTRDWYFLNLVIELYSPLSKKIINFLNIPFVDPFTQTDLSWNYEKIESIFLNKQPRLRLSQPDPKLAWNERHMIRCKITLKKNKYKKKCWRNNLNVGKAMGKKRCKWMK